MVTASVNPRLLAYRINPPSLMRAVGLDPDPWQERLLTTEAKRILVLSTRQAGKSTTTAALGLGTILTVPQSLVVMVSASHDQSKELFLKLAEMYETLDRPVKAVKQNTSELRLANGGRVLSLPSNPKTIRGYSKAHTIICDEAALMMDEMFTSVAPMRAVSGGRLILISTPKGQRGYFHEQWENGGTDWERFRVSADQCPRISAEFLAGERRTMGESQFEQEYFCHLPDTLARMANGSTKAIAQLEIGDVLTYNDLASESVKPCSVVAVRMTGEKDILSVKTEIGTTFTASANHGVRTRAGKTPLSEAKELHYVRNTAYRAGKDEAAARVAAYNTGDGTIAIRTATWRRKDRSEGRTPPYPQASWYSNCRDDLERLAADIVIAGISEKPPRVLVKKGNGTESCPDIFQVHVSHSAAEKLVALGCPVGKKKHQAFEVPEWVREGSESVQREYLAALFGAEGATPIRRSGPSTRLCNAPALTMHKARKDDGDRFFSQLSTMLGNVGIPAHFTTREVKGDVAFRLVVDGSPDNIAAFFCMVGYRYAGRKEELAFQWASYIAAYRHEATERRARIRRLRKEGWRYASIDRLLKNPSGYSKHLAVTPATRPANGFPHFADWIESRWADNGIYLRIEQQEPRERQGCFNIEVDSPDHSYLLADGLDNFNCRFVQADDQYFSTDSINRAFDGADPPDDEIL